MNSMDLYIIMAQRKESYPGQFAPEALDVADEWCQDDNPDWLRERLEHHRNSNEFEAVEVIRLTVDMDAIQRRLRPTIKTISANVE